MNYLIGDLQGCCDALDRLLATVAFSPSSDHLYLLGDLANRGPATLATLRRVHNLAGSATTLLGNHDLHLIAVAHGLRRPQRGDTLDELLAAPDRDALVDWLRHQPLAAQAHGWLMVHAGVPPQWDAAGTLTIAGEVERELQGPDPAAFLRVMYGNEPARWEDDLAGDDRLRFAVNALTRMRFCRADGTLDLKAKENAALAADGLIPWFEVPGRRTEGVPIAFGHWSTLGLVNRPDLLALDTGCIWGGRLTAVRIDGGAREVFQVECEQAQAPG